jgi:hypothetical protein
MTTGGSLNIGLILAHSGASESRLLWTFFHHGPDPVSVWLSCLWDLFQGISEQNPSLVPQ